MFISISGAYLIALKLLHCCLLPLVYLTSVTNSWGGGSLKQSFTSRQWSLTALVSSWHLSSSHPEDFAVQLAHCCDLRPLGAHACLGIYLSTPVWLAFPYASFSKLTFEQAALAFFGESLSALNLKSTWRLKTPLPGKLEGKDLSVCVLILLVH